MGKRGPAPGTGGRPRKDVSERIAEGNRDHREIKILSFGDKAEQLEKQAIPDAPDYLSDEQMDGEKLIGEEIYQKTCKWLEDRGCLSLVSPQLIERYSMAHARWVQCERKISENGFTKENPDSGNVSKSPLVVIADQYMAQANRLWSEIFQIVRESCLTEYKGATPQDDMMEELLRSRKG